jgi:hypothetical protein
MRITLAMKYSLILILFALSNLSVAEGIALLSYPDMFGESRLYIKNAGPSKVVVLTENLIQTTIDSSIEIQVPYTFVKSGSETIKLKQSIVKYAPVKLKPGEMAFLNSTIPQSAQDVSYSISKEFGEVHGTWHGTVRLKK